MSDPVTGAGRPSKGQVAARNQARQIRRRVLEEGTFGGGFDVPEVDISPTEAAVESFRRALGMVRWIESQMARWAPDLMPLVESQLDDRGALQSMPSHEAGWLEWWMQERRELREAIRLCHVIGVEERQMALQEQQADMVFTILEAAFEALELTPDQRRRVPELMPQLIRSVAMPGAGGVVHVPQL